VTYFRDRNAIIWAIKQFTSSKEYLAEEEGGDHWKAPIEVNFVSAT
jgi:hypothetical protein